jgi:hypothetical protein
MPTPYLRRARTLFAGFSLLLLAPLAAFAQSLLIPARDFETSSTEISPELLPGSEGYQFEFLEAPAEIHFGVPSSQADWSAFDRVVVRLYSPAVRHDRMILKIEPEGDYAGSFWWLLVRSDWVGWKDIPVFITGPGYGRLTPTEKGGKMLPKNFGQVKAIVFRNQWGAPDARDVARWGIAEPSPGTWRFGGVTSAP